MVTASQALDDGVQDRVRQVLQRLVDDGAERGAQVAAYLDGELAAHVWAGSAAPGLPVDGRTLFPAFSVAKGVVATVLHVLVERGAFGYGTRVADLWPEFAAHGKHAVTVDHLLEHSAGVPYFPPGLTADDLLDPAAISARLADTVPEWPPGQQTGYHSFTFGYIAAELVRRATGSDLDQLVHDLLAEPLGLADELFLSPPDALADRLADVESDDFAAVFATVPRDAPFVRAVGGMDVTSIVPRRTTPPGRSWQADAPLPIGVTMTARAGAALYATLANGGELAGVRVLRADTIEQARTVRRRDTDRILGEPALKSRGYANGDAVSGGLESAFGFGGLGGSEAYADPDHRFSFAFTHNLLTPPTRSDSAPAVAHEVRAALGIDRGPAARVTATG